MNLVTCPHCQQVYAATNFDACPECGKSAPKTGVTVDKARKRPKTRKSQSSKQKRLSLTQRLQVAGLTSDDAIRDAIPTGALTDALYHTTGDTGEAVLRDYMAIVERVAGEDSSLMKYKYRLVSGVAA